MDRIDEYVTEQLVVDVPVQFFRQLGEAHLRLHLQEHQRHLPFRGEVGLPSAFRNHALAHEPEALRHLMQREDLLHPSQFALLTPFIPFSPQKPGTRHSFMADCAGVGIFA